MAPCQIGFVRLREIHGLTRRWGFVRNTLYDILPNTWAAAVRVLAKSQGFAPELFHRGIVSNLSFSDHSETKLRVKGLSDEHAIISTIAVVLGNTASSKKSHMENMLKRLVSQHPDIQNQNIRTVSLSNGTIKGFRTALEEVKYAIITSSEPTHTIRTPYPEDPDGSHPLPRIMINAWTQWGG